MDYDANADKQQQVDSSPEQQQQGAQQSGGGISLNIGFIRTPPGLLMLINIALLFLSWCIMAGWRGEFVYYGGVGGNSGFFLWCTVIPWIIFLVVFALMLFNVHTKLAQFVNIPVTVMLNCAVWAILLFIASCLVANDARVYSRWTNCYGCHTLGAAAAFGFFSTVGLAFQAFLHFREWRSDGSPTNVSCVMCC